MSALVTALAQARKELRSSAREHKRQVGVHRRQAARATRALEELENACKEHGITLDAQSLGKETQHAGRDSSKA